MNRIRECIKIFLCVFVLFIAALVIVRKMPKNEEGKEKDSYAKELVEEETFARLLDESNDEVIKQKVLNHIDSGKYYHIQEEIEYKDRIYKSIQISNLSYPNRDYPGFEYNHEEHDIFYIYNSKDIKLKARLDEQLSEDYIVKHNTKEYDDFFRVIEYHCPSVKATNCGDRISFRRDENFGFMKEFSISALLCYNKNGYLEDIKVFQGAVGIHLIEDVNDLVWKVYYAEEEVYYWIGLRYPKYRDYINGWGYSSGSVYGMHINEKGQIYEIEYLHKSEDNLWEDIFANEDSYFAHKKYVKNYSLSVWDIINSKIDKELLDASLSQNEVYDVVRDRFGKETIRIMEDVFSISYSTKEGYIVRFAPYTDEESNQKKFRINYVKLTAEEYMNIENEEKYEYINKNEKPFFIDGKINPELLEELEKD